MRMEKGDRWRWFDSGCGPGSWAIFVLFSELKRSGWLPSIARREYSDPTSKFRVSFGNQAVNFLGPIGLHQVIPKRLAHEHPGNLGQGLEMETGGVDRGEEHEKDLRRLAIHGVKVNPLKTAAEAQHEPGKLGQLAMRDGDVIADTGAPEALPVQQHLHHGLE